MTSLIYLVSKLAEMSTKCGKMLNFLCYFNDFCYPVNTSYRYIWRKKPEIHIKLPSKYVLKYLLFSTSSSSRGLEKMITLLRHKRLYSAPSLCSFHNRGQRIQHTQQKSGGLVTFSAASECPHDSAMKHTWSRELEPSGWGTSQFKK